MSDLNDAIDIDVSDMGGPVGTVEPETTDAESSPVETKDTEEKLPGFDDDVEPKLPKETEAKPVEEKSEPEPSEETKEEPAAEGEEKLKPKSENRFQQLANDNRELKAEIERLKSQEAQVANEQELLNEVNPETGDYYTPQEVERIAFQRSREQQQQSIAQQRYQLEVQQSQQQLVSDATKALQEYPMFDEQSKEYDPELSGQVDQLLQANLIFDPQTNAVIGSRVSPYQIIKTIADATKSYAAKGEVQGQRATEKMLAASDTPSSGGPKPEKKDSFLDGFESV